MLWIGHRRPAREPDTAELSRLYSVQPSPTLEKNNWFMAFAWLGAVAIPTITFFVAPSIPWLPAALLIGWVAGWVVVRVWRSSGESELHRRALLKMWHQDVAAGRVDPHSIH